MISIIILTKNEAQDLPACLAALEWCDDVHVLDSGSTDDTQNIVRKSGATWHAHPFESFGKQRNWALDHCGCRHEWVLFLDADEVATPEFVQALKTAIASADAETAGFYCCWKMMWGTVWLRRSDSFPKWQFRVLRRGRARFTDFGHGQKEAEVRGQLRYVREPYLHYAFSKGLAVWHARHERYASQEAVTRLKEKLNWQELFSAHGSVRNKALKLALSRFPGWPAFRFVWAYIVKLGFLEGRAGYDYCRLLAGYEALIQRKMKSAKTGVAATPR